MKQFRRKRNRTSRNRKAILAVLLLVICILTIVLVWGRNKGDTTLQGSPGPNGSSVPGGTEPPSDADYEEITLLSVGDIMFHGDQLNGAYDEASRSYDFTRSMQYVKDTISKADYAVANLETTLNGGSPSSYPSFNSPDSVLDALQYAGFDLLLLSNNHSYDTRSDGVIRTWNTVRAKGFDTAGTVGTQSAASYFVKNIKGIRVGFLDYGYESGDRENGDVFLNGIRVKAEYAPLLDTFHYGMLDEFYEEVNARISAMKAQGADIIVFYIHWGDEYHLEPNGQQKAIAQQLCNLGVDVIIGSHPHVIQPMEILRAEQGDHQTICFYSMGNFLSNQNRVTLTGEGLLSTARSVYTENGLIVTMSIRKYRTGQTVVSRLSYTPTWVHRYETASGRLTHEIVPLPMANAEPEEYGLTGSSFGIRNAASAMALTDDLFEQAVAAFNQSAARPTEERSAA